MEKNLVHLQELRKSLVATAPSKSINLFFINFDQVGTFSLQELRTNLADTDHSVSINHIIN
jgi:hypothetical protein